MIELGCFPGRLMEFFHRMYGHDVTGLEYIEESCHKCEAMLAAKCVPATVIHGDLFEDEWAADHPLWDVVFSAGLIEHFDDSSPAIERHLRLVAPKGHCVITIPNHSGLNGRLKKIIDRRMWDLHNLMDADRLRDAFERSPSSDRFELLVCRYVEHVGLWNCGLYGRLQSIGRPAFLLGRSMGFVVEAAARWTPNTRLLSPNIVMVARERG